MRFSRQGWIIIAVSTIITLGILTFGSSIWQGFTLDKPLEQSLSRIAGIEKVSFEENPKTKVITIHVTIKDIENLQQSYKKVMDDSANLIGDKKFVIVLHDNRSLELANFYDGVSYIVQEGIQTGNFSLMVERLQAKAAAAHYDIRLSIDNRSIYLSLRDGKTQLYEVIPR